MQILGLETAVSRVNSLKRCATHNAYHHLLTRLSPPLRYFLETGKGTLPYIDLGYELAYADPKNTEKRLQNRFIAFTGDTKIFTTNSKFWMEHYLLDTVKLNRIFTGNNIANLNTSRFEWVSNLVVLSKMKPEHFMQMKWLKMSHLESLDITVDGKLSEECATIMLNEWDIPQGMTLTIHSVKGDDITFESYAKLMDKFNLIVTTFPFRHNV